MTVFIIGIGVGIIVTGLVLLVRHDMREFLWSWAANS